MKNVSAQLSKIINTNIIMRSLEIMKKRNCTILKEKYIKDKINLFDFVKLISHKL